MKAAKNRTLGDDLNYSRKGPRMDPWGTPRASVKRDQKQVLMNVWNCSRREARVDA